MLFSNESDCILTYKNVKQNKIIFFFFKASRNYMLNGECMFY